MSVCHCWHLEYHEGATPICSHAHYILADNTATRRALIVLIGSRTLHVSGEAGHSCARHDHLQQLGVLGDGCQQPRVQPRAKAWSSTHSILLPQPAALCSTGQNALQVVGASAVGRARGIVRAESPALKVYLTLVRLTLATM